jgi:multiple sugar transport system substrate-binding protein
VVLVLLALLAAACAPAQPATTQPPAAEPTQPPAEEPTQPPAQEKVVLHIMDNWGNQTDAKGPPLHSIFDDFMKANPDIVIQEDVFADSEIVTKVETAFLAGEEPDLVFQNYPYGGSDDWIETGVAIDVAGFLDEWGMKDLFKEAAIKQYTDSQGRIVSFPLEGFTWPMWYNMKILKEAGVNAVPTTIDELIDAATKVRAAGYQPLSIGGGDWEGLAFFNLANSALMTDQEFGEYYKNGDFSKSENFVKSVDLFVKLRDAGVFADNAEGLEFATMNELFFSGKAAMLRAGSWSFSELPKEMQQDVVVAGFPLPEGSPHAKPIVAAGYVGKGVWITRNGAQKMDAVEKFVKFFFQPEHIALFVEAAGMTSPLKETPVDESKLNPLFLQTIKWGDTVAYVDVVDPYIPGTAWEDFLKVTKEAFLPGTPADKIVADMDQTWQLYK